MSRAFSTQQANVIVRDFSPGEVFVDIDFMPGPLKAGTTNTNNFLILIITGMLSFKLSFSCGW